MKYDQRSRLLRTLEAAVPVAHTALLTYGPTAQQDMLHEEVGELLTAIAREHRGRASNAEVCEEIADVMIMLVQMSILHGADEVIDALAKKTERLQKRLDT